MEIKTPGSRGTCLQHVRKYEFLHFRIMDTNGSTTNFDAIEYKIVMLSPDLVEAPFIKGWNVFYHWRCKWMM